MRNALVLLGIWASSSAYPVDILWRKLNTNHTYQDLASSCSSIKPGGQILFSAEHEDGKLLRANLSNYENVFPHTFNYKSLSFSPDQMAKIEMYKDAGGRFWIKRLPLDETALKWILYYGSERSSFCPLPQKLSSLSPAPVLYEFETEDLDDGILLSYSQKVSFKGERSDGEKYSATLFMVQREYP